MTIIIKPIKIDTYYGFSPGIKRPKHRPKPRPKQVLNMLK